MKTTFDTNTYRPVVEPERYINHPDYTSFKALHDAVRAGRIQPFACETMFTLEAVMRVDRAAYLASRRLTSEIRESDTTACRVENVWAPRPRRVSRATGLYLAALDGAAARLSPFGSHGVMAAGRVKGTLSAHLTAPLIRPGGHPMMKSAASKATKTYAGLDVSLKETAICIVDDGARIIFAWYRPTHK